MRLTLGATQPLPMPYVTQELPPTDLNMASPDIFGTISSSGEITTCQDGPGPLRPGQSYCPGILETQALNLKVNCINSGGTWNDRSLSCKSALSGWAAVPTWAWVAMGGLIVFIAAMGGGGRRR